MDSIKEGGSLVRPPLLDGTNYDYWKARMVAFLKSMDNKTWKAIVKGWKHPVVVSKEGTSTTELKPEEEWTKEEDVEAHGNSKALNVIFNGVDNNIFRLINTCTVAKEAWEILKTAHEGTSRVRMSRLQLLTTQFENLRMKEYESISDFHMRLRDLANTSFALGEQMSEEKLARKILRSLPKKFDMKVTAIEEAQDISNIKVDELIGSLQTFEMSLNDRSNKKNKNIAFVSKTEEDEGQSKNETANQVKAFAGKCDSGYGSSDEDISDEELAETYKLLYIKWEEACMHGEKQKKIINDLHLEKQKLLTTIFNLQEEVSLLNSKLQGMTKSIRMLNNSSNVLDEILEVGKMAGDMKGIGFDYGSTNKERKVPPKKLVSIGKQTDYQMSNHMLQQSAQHMHPQSRNIKNSTWRCHHCGKYGHIRPYCYKLYGYPQPHGQSRFNRKKVQARKEWKPKDIATGFIAHTSPGASIVPVSVLVGPVDCVTANIVNPSETVSDSHVEIVVDSGSHADCNPKIVGESAVIESSSVPSDNIVNSPVNQVEPPTEPMVETNVDSDVELSFGQKEAVTEPHVASVDKNNEICHDADSEMQNNDNRGVVQEEIVVLEEKANSSSNSETDVEDDVQDIVPSTRKKEGGVMDFFFGFL